MPQKERLWNRNYIRVMGANMLLFFAFYLLTPLLPLYLSEHFDASKDTIGLVLSGYTIAAMLSRPVSGYLVDTFPRKQVLMWVFFLFFLCFAGYAAAGTLLLFALLRTLHGAPFGALTVANSTVAIDVLPSSRRNEGIGYYGLSNNLAMAAAPTVGMFIYHYVHNFDVLFWLAFITAGLGMALDATVRLPRREPVRERRALSLDRFFLVKGLVLAANMTFCGFCFGVLSNYLAIYSKEVLGMTGGTGTYFLLLSAGLIASRLQGSKSLRKGRLTQNAVEGLVLSTLGYGAFALSTHPAAYYGSAVLIGLGNGHLWPAAQNMIIGMAHHNERGTANSTILVSWDVGIGLGVFLGGIVAEHAGYGAAFLTMAASHVVALLLFLACTKRSYLRHRIVE